MTDCFDGVEDGLDVEGRVELGETLGIIDGIDVLGDREGRNVIDGTRDGLKEVFVVEGIALGLRLGRVVEGAFEGLDVAGFTLGTRLGRDVEGASDGLDVIGFTLGP